MPKHIIDGLHETPNLTILAIDLPLKCFLFCMHLIVEFLSEIVHLFDMVIEHSLAIFFELYLIILFSDLQIDLQLCDCFLIGFSLSLTLRHEALHLGLTVLVLFFKL